MGETKAEASVIVEVDRSEQEEHPAYTWNRSLPVEQRHEGGADPNVLREIHEYDPTIVLRWDPKVQLVAVFQCLPGQEPRLICHDEQGAGVIDHTLLPRLATWDLRNYGMSFRTLWVAMEQAKRERSREARRRIWEGIDHSESYRAHQHFMRMLDGNPRGLRSWVPDDLVSANRALDRKLHELHRSVVGTEVAS